MKSWAAAGLPALAAAPPEGEGPHPASGCQFRTLQAQCKPLRLAIGAGTSKHRGGRAEPGAGFLVPSPETEASVATPRHAFRLRIPPSALPLSLGAGERPPPYWGQEEDGERGPVHRPITQEGSTRRTGALVAPFPTPYSPSPTSPPAIVRGALYPTSPGLNQRKEQSLHDKELGSPPPLRQSLPLGGLPGRDRNQRSTGPVGAETQ